MPAAARQSFLLLDELEETLASGKARKCERMFARIADLFVSGARRFSYSAQQIALFDDVLVRLAAETALMPRTRLAQRLAYAENAPPKLIRCFAFDDAIEVARPVLTYSPRLGDGDLSENASTKGQDHLHAIVRRAGLSEVITEVLLERGNDRVVRTLVRNAGARFSAAGYGKLTTRATADGVLAFGMVQRVDIPRDCLRRLIETASPCVRAVLEATHPQAGALIAAAAEHAGGARPAVADQHMAQTVAALAELCPYPANVIERALREQGADMVLVFAKAARCSWSTAKELLLTGERGLSSNDIDRCHDTFVRLRPETALSIINVREPRAGRPAPAADAPSVSASIAVLASLPPDQT